VEEEAEEPFRDFATMRDLALTPRRGSGRAATVDALRWSRLSSRERPSLATPAVTRPAPAAPVATAPAPPSVPPADASAFPACRIGCQF